MSIKTPDLLDEIKLKISVFSNEGKFENLCSDLISKKFPEYNFVATTNYNNKTTKDPFDGFGINNKDGSYAAICCTTTKTTAIKLIKKTKDDLKKILDKSKKINKFPKKIFICYNTTKEYFDLENEMINYAESNNLDKEVIEVLGINKLTNIAYDNLETCKKHIHLLPTNSNFFTIENAKYFIDKLCTERLQIDKKYHKTLISLFLLFAISTVISQFLSFYTGLIIGIAILSILVILLKEPLDIYNKINKYKIDDKPKFENEEKLFFKRKEDYLCIAYKLKAKCTHPSCLGYINIYKSSESISTDNGLIGICSLGGDFHLYSFEFTGDFNGIGIPILI